jgi:hypothetical protein
VLLGRGTWRAGIALVVIAAIANVGIYLVAAAAGVFPGTTMLDGPGGSQTMDVGAVVSSSVLFALLATIAFVLIVRFVPRGRERFRWIALAALVVSFGMPLTIAGAPFTYLAALGLMHVAEAAIAIWLFTTAPIAPHS